MWGSIVLFVFGILVGVLLTFSVVNRLQSDLQQRQIALTDSIISPNKHESGLTQESSPAQDSSFLLKPLPDVSSHVPINPASASLSTLHVKQTQNTAPNKLAILESIKWTPGKEGAIERLQSRVSEISAEFADVQSATSTATINTAAVVPELQPTAVVEEPNSDELTERRGRTGKKGIRGARNSGRSSTLKYNPSDYANSSVKYFVYHPVSGQMVDVLSDSSSNVNSLPSGEYYLPYPPLPAYHSQAQTESRTKVPFIPTLHSISLVRNHPWVSPVEKSRPLPNMTLQRAIFEPSNLKLHLCNGVFEAYSASYLTTKEHILAVKSENFNLSYVNCEMASFVHMREHRNFYSNPNGHGMIIQSLDVLDFSVIHLSAFERSSKKYKDVLWQSKEDRKKEWSKIDAVKKTGLALDAIINPKKTGKLPLWSNEAKKTVVIMPFLGGIMGAGHSELGNRFEYLRACFWSLYEFMPNIVPGVTRQEDVDWCKKESGLPFFDVLLVENLPKGASLPLATVRTTKMKLLTGEWNFDYIFFTESDQILISRVLPMMYEELKKFPQRMILPHRLMPYSNRVIKEVHKRQVDEVQNSWMNQSCCLPRQNCQERKTWVGIANPQVPVINYYGLYVPLGNVNFLDEQYRSCTLSPYVGDYCP